MQRMIGFIVGISLVAAIVLAGSSRWQATDPVAAPAPSVGDAPPPSVPMHAPPATLEAEPAPQPPSEAVATQPEPPDDDAPMTPVEALEQTVALETQEDAETTDEAASIDDPSQVDDEPPRPEDVAEQPEANWHVFWRPFRSRLSATGFTDRLAQVTGLDYRVVQIEPGSYQVAVSFTDDDDLDQRIATIEAATGLRLRGGTL